MLIIKGHHNHMHHTTSNHGGNLPDRGSATVENKSFQMTQLLSSSYIGVIDTIHLKIVYLDYFRPYSVNPGERYQ